MIKLKSVTLPNKSHYMGIGGYTFKTGEHDIVSLELHGEQVHGVRNMEVRDTRTAVKSKELVMRISHLSRFESVEVDLDIATDVVEVAEDPEPEPKEPTEDDEPHQETPKPTLTFKQERFVRAYAVVRSPEKAAIVAGYSEKTAKAQGQRMLKLEKIQDAIHVAIHEAEQKG
ncbi:MAG: terminase small subunit [Aestuariibacter sp.]|nr:terminase small subunit [Aestuariibacter sp.]